MKNSLIKLANRKGFRSPIIGKSAKSVLKTKPFYYLWMCELQKWLRELHHIEINIIRLTKGYIFYVHITGDKKRGICKKGITTYEKCLEEALIESLKLIKE